jgi:uncharacterized membrane protein YfcA
MTYTFRRENNSYSWIIQMTIKFVMLISFLCGIFLLINDGASQGITIVGAFTIVLSGSSILRLWKKASLRSDRDRSIPR